MISMRPDETNQATNVAVDYVRQKVAPTGVATPADLDVVDTV